MLVDTKDLHQDTLNFNKGTHEGSAMMEQSLKRLKAGRSILIDKDNNIVAGNKTVEAAEKLGLKVRIVETEGDVLVAVKRTDISLDSKEGRELAIADNATSQINLKWDPDAIQAASDQFDGFNPDDWQVDFEKNAPFLKSQGEIDTSTFDIEQELKIVLPIHLYKKVINELKSYGDDLSESLLTIMGYYDE